MKLNNDDNEKRPLLICKFLCKNKGLKSGFSDLEMSGLAVKYFPK